MLDCAWAVGDGQGLASSCGAIMNVSLFDPIKNGIAASRLSNEAFISRTEVNILCVSTLGDSRSNRTVSRVGSDCLGGVCGLVRPHSIDSCDESEDWEERLNRLHID